ncbi:MAG TPA: beta-ketoacyl synthase chain length factor [Spirochaetota bacterium]|nr:beta-ketoacyl synthase chain length factor [Spirochaetota bacterium]
MNYSNVEDICIINSFSKDKRDFIKSFNDGVLTSEELFDKINLTNAIENVDKNINSPIKKRMSEMSRGIFYVLEEAPGKNLSKDEDIFLFTAFGEIDTTDKIIKTITLENASLVSPTLFHNSVHNTPLGYYTIIKKIHNYCGTISDGILTGRSFINFIKNRAFIQEKFTVTSGEEYSPFFDLDILERRRITPAFVAYRVIPNSDRGFRYIGEFDDFEKIKETNEYKKAKYIFGDLNNFKKYNKTVEDKIFATDYPLFGDNPCSVIFRLSLPFFLEIRDFSLVIEEIEGKIFLFEVNNNV